MKNRTSHESLPHTWHTANNHIRSALSARCGHCTHATNHRAILAEIPCWHSTCSHNNVVYIHYARVLCHPLHTVVCKNRLSYLTTPHLNRSHHHRPRCNPTLLGLPRAFVSAMDRMVLHTHCHLFCNHHRRLVQYLHCQKISSP